MSLQITPPSSQHIPSCSPNLLPFHIAYTGSAPISTFFPISPASEQIGGGSPGTPTISTATSDATSTTVGVDEATDAKKDEVSPSVVPDAIATAESAAPPLPPTETQERVEIPSSTRFLSSFRGRIVQGLKVDVPTGYTGVVLAAESANGKPKKPTMKEKVKKVLTKATRSSPRKGGRATRSTRANAMDVDEEDQEAEDEEMNGDDDQHDDSMNDGAPIRTLVPASQFTSFVLWHPDIPVDEGKDEYFRTLNEWTSLADVIHRTED